MTRCNGTTRTGTRCRNAGDKRLGKGYCRIHHYQSLSVTPTTLPEQEQGQKQKPEPIFTARMVLLGAVGLGLFIAEYIEMWVLEVPRHITISGYDMTALAIGNLPAVLLSSLGILFLLLFLMIALVILLVVPVWLIWFVVSVVLGVATAGLVVLGTSLNQGLLRLMGGMVAIPRIASPDLHHRLVTRRTNIQSRVLGIFMILGDRISRSAWGLANWSARIALRPFAGLWTIIHAPHGRMKKAILYLCLIGVLTLSNYGLANNYHARITALADTPDKETEKTEPQVAEGTCKIALTLPEWGDVIKDAVTIADACYESYAAWIQPVKKGWLILSPRHPVDASAEQARQQASDLYRGLR